MASSFGNTQKPKRIPRIIISTTESDGASFTDVWVDEYRKEGIERPFIAVRVVVTGTPVESQGHVAAHTAPKSRKRKRVDESGDADMPVGSSASMPSTDFASTARIEDPEQLPLFRLAKSISEGQRTELLFSFGRSRATTRAECVIAYPKFLG